MKDYFVTRDTSDGQTPPYYIHLELDPAVLEISLTLYKVGTSLRLTLIAGPSGEENCPPTPPLSQHFALREKHVLILA